MIFAEATLLPRPRVCFIDSTVPGSEFVFSYKVTRPNKRKDKKEKWETVFLAKSGVCTIHIFTFIHS